MGGADQWGNITAGLELIRRTTGGDEAAEPAHGLAYKLLLSPSGAKFGKSDEGESVWLDPARTTPFAFYQYWLNTDDRDIGTYLRWFTEFSARGDRGARGRVGGATRAPAGPAGAGPRHHGPYARRGGRRSRRSPIPRRCSRPTRSPIRPCCGRCSNRPAGFRFDPAALDSGVAVLLAEAGVFASRGEARRIDRRRRADGQRVAGDRPGVRPGADRRGVARRPDRQAPTRGGPAGPVASLDGRARAGPGRGARVGPGEAAAGAKSGRTCVAGLVSPSVDLRARDLDVRGRACEATEGTGRGPAGRGRPTRRRPLESPGEYSVGSRA